jgi:very-short-patch-repair endonuclease
LGLEREPRYVHNIPAARRLRRPQTETEQALWEQLRARRFHGLKFRRQHAVHHYVVDFYCSELMLAIEIDGGIHDDPEVQARDRGRQAYLESQGVRFIPLPAAQVRDDIEGALLELAEAISLSPVESGERVGE